MSKQTSVEWFATQLYEKFEMKGDGSIIDNLLEQATEMHKQEIFVSKGSGETQMERKLLKSGFIDIVPKEENHIVDTNEMVELPQQEISDEEIEKEADTHENEEAITWVWGFAEGAKWYREQLKQRNG